MFSKIYNAFQLIRKGHFAILFKELKKRIYSRSVSFGLQRDLNDEFETPSAKIHIQIRRLRKEDVDELLDPTTNESVNPRILASRKSMVNANISTCYVAVTANDKPCFIQWLIGYEENQKLEEFFGGAFPPLKESEALLEGAYSNPDYRGLRIMPRTAALIAEKAAELDARWVNTFVDVKNIPSLKGCQRAGFKPYLIRKDRWLFFHRTTTFHPISDTMIDHFYEVTESNRPKTTSEKHEKSVANDIPKVEKTLKTSVLE